MNVDALGLTDDCGMATTSLIALSHFCPISLRVVAFVFVLVGLGGIQSVIRCGRWGEG